MAVAFRCPKLSIVDVCAYVERNKRKEKGGENGFVNDGQKLKEPEYLTFVKPKIRHAQNCNMYWKQQQQRQ